MQYVIPIPRIASAYHKPPMKSICPASQIHSKLNGNIIFLPDAFTGSRFKVDLNQNPQIALLLFTFPLEFTE
jgi:hypothetical protein